MGVGVGRRGRGHGASDHRLNPLANVARGIAERADAMPAVIQPDPQFDVIPTHATPDGRDDIAGPGHAEQGRDSGIIGQSARIETLRYFRAL